MAFNQKEKLLIEAVVGVFIERHRPPVHLREKVDWGFHLSGESVEIFEIRPQFNKPAVKLQHAFAKATRVKSRDVWKVYWMRGNLKWHPHEPAEVKELEDFLAAVDKDKHHCFFG